MVSFAMLISNAVYKSYELANFGVWFVVGGGLQLIFRRVLDVLIAPGRDLDAEMDSNYNWWAACYHRLHHHHFVSASASDRHMVVVWLAAGASPALSVPCSCR